jgi:PPM family protein phosphatase
MTQVTATTLIEIAGLTDSGRLREMNEDHWAHSTLPSGELVMVADGMGGHRTGEVASSLATEALLLGMQELPGTPPEALPRAMQRSNFAVYQQSARRAESRGMGTTMTAVLIDGNAAVIGHVGDSRAYLVRGDTITQLTRDHSWVAEKVRQGLITESEARDHKWRNVITNALGSRPQLRLDLFGVDLRDGDLLLLCSDGLSNMLTDEEMLELIRNEASTPLERLSQKMVDAANEAGGPDNISVVLVKVKRAVPRRKQYPLPLLGRDPAPAVEELPMDSKDTFVYDPAMPEGASGPRRNQTWMLVVLLILYVVLVGLLLNVRR